MDDAAVSRKMVRTWLTGVPLLQHRQTQWCALMGIQSLANLVKTSAICEQKNNLSSNNSHYMLLWHLQMLNTFNDELCSKRR